MKPTIYVLNGPNLNLLGRRDPAHYGTATLDEIARTLHDKAAAMDVAVDIRQSNHEGHLIDWLHEAMNHARAVIINAGGYSHSSVAIRDAVEALPVPVIEVHLSNIHGRERFRRTSLIAPVANGSIVGFGPFGYLLALDAAVDLCKGAACRGDQAAQD